MHYARPVRSSSSYGARGILAKRKNNHAMREAPAKLRHLQADLQQHQHEDASSTRLLYMLLSIYTISL